MENDTDNGSLEFGSHRTEVSLLEPYLYLAEVSGKDVRGELIESFQVKHCTAAHTAKLL